MSVCVVYVQPVSRLLPSFCLTTERIVQWRCCVTISVLFRRTLTSRWRTCRLRWWLCVIGLHYHKYQWYRVHHLYGSEVCHVLYASHPTRKGHFEDHLYGTLRYTANFTALVVVIIINRNARLMEKLSQRRAC